MITATETQEILRKLLLIRQTGDKLEEGLKCLQMYGPVYLYKGREVVSRWRLLSTAFPVYSLGSSSLCSALLSKRR